MKGNYLFLISLADKYCIVKVYCGIIFDFCFYDLLTSHSRFKSFWQFCTDNSMSISINQ